MKSLIAILSLVLTSSAAFSSGLTQVERDAIIDNAAVKAAQELAKQPQELTDSQSQVLLSAAVVEANKEFAKLAEILKIDSSIMPVEKTPKEKAHLRFLMCAVSKATVKNSYFETSLSLSEQANVEANVESNCK